MGKQPYVPLGPAPFVPLVAVLWPRRRATEFLCWSETAARITRADDGNVARWMRQTRQEFMVTVPSIVEHDDFTPTVKGGRPETQGKDRSRVALLLADDASRLELVTSGASLSGGAALPSGNGVPGRYVTPTEGTPEWQSRRRIPCSRRSRKT